MGCPWANRLAAACHLLRRFGLEAEAARPNPATAGQLCLALKAPGTRFKPHPASGLALGEGFGIDTAEKAPWRVYSCDWQNRWLLASRPGKRFLENRDILPSRSHPSISGNENKNSRIPANRLNHSWPFEQAISAVVDGTLHSGIASSCNYNRSFS